MYSYNCDLFDVASFTQHVFKVHLCFIMSHYFALFFKLHSFLLMNNIPLYGSHIMFIHASIDEDFFPTFWLLWIVLLWAFAYRFLFKLLFAVLWGYIPRSGITGSQWWLSLSLRKCQIFFTDAMAFYWRRKWQHTPVFLPGKFHGQKSLEGYSPWRRKESRWLSN